MRGESFGVAFIGGEFLSVEGNLPSGALIATADDGGGVAGGAEGKEGGVAGVVGEGAVV